LYEVVVVLFTYSYAVVRRREIAEAKAQMDSEYETLYYYH